VLTVCSKFTLICLIGLVIVLVQQLLTALYTGVECRKPKTRIYGSSSAKIFRLMKQWKKLFKETAHAMLLELKSSMFVLQSQIYLLALGEILNLWRRSVQRYVLQVTRLQVSPELFKHYWQFMWIFKLLVSLLRTELVVLLMSLHIYLTRIKQWINFCNC